MKISFLKRFIFPNICVGCEQVLDENINLCNSCYAKINFLKEHYCHICGSVIPNNISICDKCITNPPPFRILRSVFSYDDYSKSIIINFKFFDNLIHVKVFAKWMYQVDRDIFDNSEVIIPIPLHRFRLFRRKYNQAALLAKEISKLANLPYTPLVVKRIRHTKFQPGLTLKQREKNLTKAFCINNQEIIRDKVVILIDDVVTTGATVRSCAQEILNYGAKEIRVLSLARTI